MIKSVDTYLTVSEIEKASGQHNLPLFFAEAIVELARAARQGEVKPESAIIRIQGLADSIKVSLRLEPPFLKPGDLA